MAITAIGGGSTAGSGGSSGLTLAADKEISSTKAVAASDSRLSDTRLIKSVGTTVGLIPKSDGVGGVTWEVINIPDPTTDAGALTSGTLDVLRLPNTVILNTDARLSDSRPINSGTAALDYMPYSNGAGGVNWKVAPSGGGASNLSDATAVISIGKLNWTSNDILDWPTSLLTSGGDITGFNDLTVGVRLLLIPSGITGPLRFTGAEIKEVIGEDVPGRFRYIRLHCKKADAGLEHVIVTYSPDIKPLFKPEGTPSTSTTINLGFPDQYGTPAAPLVGNLTLSGTAIRETYFTVYHNDAAKPVITGPVGMAITRVGGVDYVPNAVNELLIRVLSETEVEIVVAPRTPWN